MSKATGASALLGFAIDAPSDLYSVGHPAPQIHQVGPPDTSPTAAAGAPASGSLTGDFAYRCAFGTPDGAYTEPSPATATIAAADPTGTPGLDDLTSGGTFTGSGDEIITVEIAAEGTPDTMRFRKGSGAWSTPAAIVGGAMDLVDGVTATFGATTGHTAGDSWTIVVTIDVETASAQTISVALIPLAPDNAVDRRAIERTADRGATWALCMVLYDNVTEGFIDDTPVLDASKALGAANQTGANYGFLFLEPDSFDLDPDFTMLPVAALLGTAGKPRSIPGPIKIAGSPKSDLRAADLFPIIFSGAGAPDSYAKEAGEPTWIASWGATTGKRNARTISAFGYDGAPNVSPNLLFQLACEELAFDFSGGKIDGITPKFTGANYGTSAPGAKVAGDGTWLGTFVALGQRYDADALTKSVFIKITGALSADAVKFKVSVDTHASAGTGSYGSEYTLHVNATSKAQTKGGLQYNDAIEIADQNGLMLGADEGSNRQPFTVIASAPLTTGLHVNDIYEILPTALIPGPLSGATVEPFSGIPARFSAGPRFTDAHVTITQDGNVIEATGGSLKLKWPKKDVNGLGAGARTVQDLVNEGFFGVDLTIMRFLDSSSNRNTLRTDRRFAAVIAFEGERIPINPGVLSTHREGLYVTVPQMAITSLKAPVAGQTLIVETIAAEADQPDNSSLDLYGIVLKTRQGWTVPA